MALKMDVLLPLHPCSEPNAWNLGSLTMTPAFSQADRRSKRGQRQVWRESARKEEKGQVMAKKENEWKMGGKIDRPRSPFVPSLNFSFCLILTFFSPPFLFGSNPWSFTEREKENVIKRERKIAKARQHKLQTGRNLHFLLPFFLWVLLFLSFLPCSRLVRSGLAALSKRSRLVQRQQLGGFSCCLYWALWIPPASVHSCSTMTF